MEALIAPYRVSTYEKRQLKKRLWKERPHVCWLCGSGLTWKEATLDHVKPRVEGGTYAIDNLELAHEACNIERGSMPAEHYRDILRLRKGIA